MCNKLAKNLETFQSQFLKSNIEIIEIIEVHNIHKKGAISEKNVH